MVFYTGLKHSILLCLFICGVTTIYFASKKASEQQKWLLLTLVCCFVTVLEYYQEIRAFNMPMMASAIKIGHSFKVLATLSYLQFVSRYCRIKLPKSIQLSFLIINTFVITSILTFDKNSYFYTFFRISHYGSMPYVIIKPGIMYFFFVYGLAATVCASVGILFSKMLKAHDREKTRLIFLIFAATLPIIGVFAQKLAGLVIVDLVPIGFAVSGLLLLVVVKKYGLLDVVLTAKESIIENTKEGLIVVDAEYNVLYANPAVMLSFPSIMDIKTPQEKEAFRQMFEQPESVYNKDNGIFEIRVSDIYEDKIKRGKMAWIFDMSFINNYTKEIMTLKEEAEQANQAKSTFLANMSHEIRTPMNAILGFAELILQKSVKEEIRDHAYDIKHSAENLLHIINEILDISKIESGKQEIIEEEYYTQSLLEDVMVIIESQTKKKNLEFISDIQENIPYKLYGALVQIREILINVLNNSVKYTKEGSVKLEVSFETSKEYQDEGVITFRIIDTGIGMKPEDVEKIYDRFRKFDEQENQGVEGTGLGMYIVKTLLTRMNGTIDITSVYREGTTITIKIPQKIMDSSPIGKMEVKFREEDNNDFIDFTTTAKILIVDDNEVNLKVVAGLLDKYGIKPDTALDGYKALDILKDHTYDLIFLDHMMPGIDGVETMEMIRKMDGEQNKKVPIVLLTANAIAGVKEKMLSIGFNDYLSKPIDITKMEKILLKFLPKNSVTIMEHEGVENKDWEKVLAKMSNVLRHMEVDVGIRNCGGSLPDYVDILKIVEKYGDERVAQLRDLIEKKQYDTYTINVHALKSTALNIGASELGKLALLLEEAGKKKQYAFIEEHSEELIFLYHAVLMEIRRFLILKKNTDSMMEKGNIDNFKDLQRAILEYDELKEKGQTFGDYVSSIENEYVGENTSNSSVDNRENDLGIPTDELKEILDNVKVLIEEYEQDQAIHVLQELENLIVQEELKESVLKIKTSLEKFDMEQATESLEQAIAYISD